MIDADTEVHFFDDEPDNVEKFNKSDIEYSKVGHYIGNRGGAGKPSITEKLEIMNIALEYEYKHGVKVNIIDRIVKGYNRELAIEEAKQSTINEPVIIIVRNARKGGYAYTLILNLEYNQSIKHLYTIDALYKELFGPVKVGGSRKQRKTKKSTRKQRKHKKTTRKH
jgi:hypothetical protein